jgi:transcription-repair coupling factor (superfamily II helicase)
MKQIEKLLESLKGWQQVKKAVESRKGPVLAVGLSRIHKAQFFHGLTAGGRGAVIITQDDPSAVRLCEDLNAFFGEEKALHYPSRDFLFRPVEGVSREYEHARLGVLARLLDGSCQIAVAGCEAAFQHTIPPMVLQSRRVVLRPGQVCGTEWLCQTLLSAGYTRCDQVEGKCQFSLRGGILDFFAPESDYPCRVELWGDEIDTISTFRVDTQRREDTLKQVTVSPAREVLFPVNTAQEIAALLEEKAETLTGKLQQKSRRQLLEDARRLRDGLELECYDRYLPLAYDRAAVLTD